MVIFHCLSILLVFRGSKLIPASVDSLMDNAGPSTFHSAQTVLPMMGAIGEAVPVVGGVVKAVANGLLHTLKTMDVCLQIVSCHGIHGLTM